MSPSHKDGYIPGDQITDDIIPFFRENGFLVVENAVSPAEVDAMNAETVAICRGDKGDVSRATDSLTLEELRQLSTVDLLQHFLCIHQVHKISDLMLENLAHPAIVDVLTRVIGPNVKCMQSMLFIKSSGKPGQAWHQDEDYIPTRDRSLTGAWIALDDATIENGCLWIIPASQRPGILYPQFPHNSKDYDCATMSYGFPYDEAKDAVPVEVKRGSIVFFNGYLLHKSLPNRAPAGTFRRVLVNHYMSAESFLPWSVEDGVAVSKSDFRDIVMIAGTDPHAWKGTTDTVRPHVRSAGKGGCGDGRVDLETWKQKPTECRANR